MESQKANYIINYFPRLMTESEQKANSHYFFSLQLGNPEDYESLNSYERKKEFFEQRNGISNDSQILELLEDGYEKFVLRTAERIEKETPNEFTINRCSTCNSIARTPYAKQCRQCGNDWHNEIGGEFKFDDSFRIKGRSLFWLVGDLVKGHVQVGDRIDLSNFQLNIIAKIMQIEGCLKLVNGIKKDLPSLGIEVNSANEELIKEYVTKSAKTIMILKGKVCTN